MRRAILRSSLEGGVCTALDGPAKWSNGRDELLIVKRLPQGCRRTDIAQAREWHAREDDDRNGRKADAGPLVSPKRPTIHHWHHHVQHDDAGRIVVRFVERVLPVAGDVDIEALARQHLRHQLPEIRIIVDNQNAWTHRTLVTQAPRIVPIRHRAVNRCDPHHVCSARK
jgi:hypothetical protein